MFLLRRALLLTGLLFLPGLEAASADERPLIREIVIVRGNVFTEPEAEQIAIFQIANALHFITRESVVRREFLFDEGDPVDEELIEATERALRALDFINEAQIRVVPVDKTTADLHVYTHDAWTIVPGILFESGGGITEVGLTGTDTNLAGFGKKIWFEGAHKTDVGTSFAAGYRDPQLFDTRWTASAGFRTGPLLDSVDASVVRPFYSPDTKWAFGGYGGWREETVRLFDAGDEVSRILEKNHIAQVFAARAFGERFRKFTAEALFIYNDQRYDMIAGTRTTLPDDELTLTTSLGLFWRNESWVKDKRVRKMTITEDIELGTNVGGRIGRAGVPIPYGEEFWKFSGSFRHAFALADNQYVFSSNEFSTEDDQNRILGVQGTYYLKPSTWQTLALNLKFERAWNLESSRQFTLGGESGLRGFRARRFDGNKSLLINAETRLYSPVEILTVALGAIAFVDAGRAWKRGEEVELDQFGASAGFGLRLGFTRAPSEPTGRIDFGWPLTEGGFAVTVGAEQQF